MFPCDTKSMSEIVRKVHKKKRTIVEEEEVPEVMEEVVSVSYISNTHAVSVESTVGMLIVNFLVHSKRPATTNVIFETDGGQFESLYNMDLRATLAELGIGPHILLGASGFESEGETVIALTALRNYLASMGRLPIEDQELLMSANAFLTPRATTRSRPPVVTTPTRMERGTVRDSIDVVAPIVKTVPKVATKSVSRVVRASPTRRSRTIIEEEESTSSEEEVIVRRR